jgi:aspartyl/asparaginyl beta-hydroxylase (cupin superfamily)
LQQEVLQLSGEFWKQHYNTKHYDGDWSIIPLRAVNGSMENTFSIPPGANSHIKYNDTILLEHCPQMKKAIDFFECEKTTVRLMKLEAGSVIKEHTDQEINFESGEARVHIPIFTNRQVEFYVEEERVVMQEGECWYLNLTLPHRVSNKGTEDRIHLVIDCLVNDWLKDLFANHALVQKEATIDPNKPNYRVEDKQKIIDQLRSMNTEMGNKLADQLETEN